MRYHERTKHHFARFAPGPGQLDWANQPDPFRRFEGAPLTRWPLLAPDDEPRAPPYDSLYAPGAVASAPLTRARCRGSSSTRSRSRRGSRRAARAGRCASIHRAATCTRPRATVRGPIPGCESPGLFPLRAREHALERRADCPASSTLLTPSPRARSSSDSSSIHWREAWKYGERAFRYCQHDVGHALAALALAAAALGWSARAARRRERRNIEALLGLDRADEFEGAERESAEP